MICHGCKKEMTLPAAKVHGKPLHICAVCLATIRRGGRAEWLHFLAMSGACFVGGWTPYLLGIQTRWEVALLASLIGPVFVLGGIRLMRRRG